MKYIKAVAGVVILTLLDQLTKYWAVIALKDKEPFVIWKGVFELQYLENRGIAFGLFQNRAWLFAIITVVILGFIFYYYWHIPYTKRMVPMRFTMILLASGAIGNLIDRVVNNYVVDFLYFKLIDFPIFNLADCYVTISLVILIILLFYYKEEELEFHAKRK